MLTSAVAEHMASHSSLEKFGSAAGDFSPDKLRVEDPTPRGNHTHGQSTRKWRMAEHEIEDLQEELSRKDKEVEKLKAEKEELREKFKRSDAAGYQ